MNDEGVFQAGFACSNGNFVVECHPEWAPLGAQRFRELVEEGFYDGARFFRVVPGFMVQFGLPADPKAAAKWRAQPLQDDPVTQSNQRGRVTFAATNEPNSRTTQIFINYSDNTFLDGMGFAPFGEVVGGMDTVDAINAAHGEDPDQQMIQMYGAKYLGKQFPGLDFVKKAVLVG